MNPNREDFLTFIDATPLVSIDLISGRDPAAVIDRKRPTTKC
jgi:hypothetical protein